VIWTLRAHVLTCRCCIAAARQHQHQFDRTARAAKRVEKARQYRHRAHLTSLPPTTLFIISVGDVLSSSLVRCRPRTSSEHSSSPHDVLHLPACHHQDMVFCTAHLFYRNLCACFHTSAARAPHLLFACLRIKRHQHPSSCILTRACKHYHVGGTVALLRYIA